MRDQVVRDLLSETYGQARVDAKIFRLSEIGKNWYRNAQKLQTNQEKIEQIQLDLYYGKIEELTDRKEAIKSIAELSNDNEEIREKQKQYENLEGLPHTSENTDYVAMTANERLKKYSEQFDKGFVWLPSREEIDRKAMQVIASSGNPKQTRQGVFFLSEPGSGKTEQVRAIARRLTGDDSIKISCGPRMGKPQLYGATRVFPGATKIEEGTFDDYLGEHGDGTVMSAWTGYDFSYETEPKRRYAQVVEFDEMPKAFGNENAFAIFKKIFALMDSDRLMGKPVLPNRVHFASGNMGQKYKVTEIPKALERHYEVIPVDYPEMSKENPELYEFMLAVLRKNRFKGVARQEVKPAYRRHDLSDNEKEMLPNGDTIIAFDKLIEDTTNSEHGFLYRLAYAIKAIQNSYMARGGENAYVDYTKRDLLRYEEDSDGNISVTKNGNFITLESAINLNDISGWLTTYAEEREKTKKISTLTEWIQYRLREKIGKRQDDNKFLEAIFNHFHLFDKTFISQEKEQPFTDKEIGYFSPRVPRPVYVEKPVQKDTDAQDKIIQPKDLTEIFKTIKAVLENGESVIAREGNFSFKNKQGEEINIEMGEQMIIDGKKLVLAGVIDDKNSAQNGSPISALSDEEGLYAVIEQNKIEQGILEFFADLIGETGIDDFKEDFLAAWKNEECEKEHGKFSF